eukprot:gene5779-6001_t
MMFTILGMLMLFDRGLIAMGNLLFIAGLATTIGFQSMITFFMKRKNRRGSIFYLGGCAFVLYGWSVVGLLLESYGFFLLFCEFFPTMLQFARRVPILGRLLDAPILKQIFNRVAPMGGLPTTNFEV